MTPTWEVFVAIVFLILSFCSAGCVRASQAPLLALPVPQTGFPQGMPLLYDEFARRAVCCDLVNSINQSA